jgi:hypothetical protein
MTLEMKAPEKSQAAPEKPQAAPEKTPVGSEIPPGQNGGERESR